jgi:cbb3-type cytochrome oxidase subunit 3
MITGHVQKIIILVNDLVKNPKDTYVRFSKSSYFEKYTEVVLLALFILGVRLIISSHFFGYMFLGMFFIGGRWWLLNFGNHNTHTNSQLRVYLHENKTNLPVIKEVEMDQEQKSDKESFGENIK